jgi:hypothetical protein
MSLEKAERDVFAKGLRELAATKSFIFQYSVKHMSFLINLNADFRALNQ